MTDEIIQTLQAERQRRGLTIRGLARLAGYSFSAVRYIMRGQRTHTLDFLCDLCQALGYRLTIVRIDDENCA